MQNFATKTDGSTSLSAAEFNNYIEELENNITDSGQSLDPADLHQTGKSSANYASIGDFFTDSGAANAYVLAPQGSLKGPTAYVDGMRVRFAPANSNTGASTVNVNSLGAKNIKRLDTSALIGGALLAGDIVELIFNSANNCFYIANTLTKNRGRCVSKTSSYPVTNTDEVEVIESSGAGTEITLPEPGKNVGRPPILIVRNDAVNNQVIKRFSASDTIDGVQEDLTLSQDLQKVSIRCFATNKYYTM